MDLSIDFAGITELMHGAHGEGRSFLFEYEVYSLLSRSGAETPPKSIFLPRGARFSDEELMALPGEKVVLKIVSPNIIHKTEVGGVRIIDKRPEKIRSAVRRMLYEVPENYAGWIDNNREASPPCYRELSGDKLEEAISADLKGILLVQFMPPDSMAFGNELIVGLRHTREFGMVISAGLGGTDAELYAERFRKGQAIVAALTEMNDGHSFFELFKPTIAYKKLTGLTRGQRRVVTNEQLIECFDSFIRMANYYSPSNLESPYVIEELEVNPFAFTDYLMVPLDGMCRFTTQPTVASPRPVEKIGCLLHPEKIGIIGVSSLRRNFGRIILDNILAEGYQQENVVIIREGEKEIGGVSCVASFADLEEPLDLLIVAIAAPQVPGLVEEVTRLGCARSVMLIPGGLGETEESRERAREVIRLIDESHGADGPVFLGANCMGVISRPGRYDTWFIPEEKLPKIREGKYHRAALISQSGAFMLHRSHQCPQLNPAYMISMGNQTDLTLGDMVHYFKDREEVDVIAIYAEGFSDLDGLSFCRAVRQAVCNGKTVIFYKAGRTEEGKAATSGHTASLAGDYMVCENCVHQAGAIVARNFTEFQDLFFLAETLHDKKINGNRLAAISGAGFEAVGMADSIDSDEFHMHLAEFSENTRSRITYLLEEKKLFSLVTLTNPLDITPMADDETHALVAGVVAEDEGVDGIVISLDPLSPVTCTLAGPGAGKYDMNQEEAVRNRIERLVASCEKPVVTVVDGGRLYDPLRDALADRGVPVFPVCDRAVAALSLYMQGRLEVQDLSESGN
ncbi:CoA-binding protein [Desulfomarina profundi]|uniref:CoA-binding protein n=1 Tax=Desulfomarina profundi TaxID=2772557 RepID=A0A8D5FJV3_9BACT|nr:acetate--CoA ligase family protein [Desulfomarina profundi]BCL60263.1 CoA-binding protein [Desulfomarina profundi]